MATYIQGVTDYFPQIQPFSPDYNFYSGALDFKQGAHDAGKKQLNSLYSSLLNAPLTREDNITAREHFFKVIDQDIKKMARMDLSKAQNIQAAKGVFNQFLDNDNIMKDMVWTKQFNSQLKRSEGFKNCTDPDKCGGQWWEGGERYLQYKRMEFANASADDAMRMQAPEYTPYQNVMKKAMALAKEADLNVSIDQNTGQWITTTKNGAAIVKPLEDLFLGTLGQDPAIAQYYKTKAFVDRKDFSHTNAARYGSVEAAEQIYINNVIKATGARFKDKEIELEDAQNHVNAKREKALKAAQRSVPSKQKSLAELADSFANEGQAYESSLQTVKGLNGEMDVAANNQQYSPENIDAIVAGKILESDIGVAAQTLAFKDYEVKLRANPYAVESQRFRNRLMLEDMRFKNQTKLMKYQWDLDMFAKQLEEQGEAEDNVPENVMDVKGGTSVGNMDPESKDYQQRTFNAYKAKREGVRTDLSAAERNIFSSIKERTLKAAESGDPMAKEDYVNLVQNYIAATQSDRENIDYVGSGDSENGNIPESGRTTTPSNVAKYRNLSTRLANAKTMDEKYIIAKEANLDPTAIAGGQVDVLYESTMANMMNPENGNDSMRDYLAPVWKQSAGLRRQIQAKNRVLEQMDANHASESRDVIKSARSSNNFSPDMIDALESYVDDKGYTVNKETFVANMVAKGYDADEAGSLYRGDVEEPGIWDWIRPDNFMSSVGLARMKDLWEREEQEGTPGIHDLWRQVYTSYAKPNSDTAWLGITGGGDETSIGQRYAVVDPGKFKSVATQGTVGFIADGVKSGNAVFDFGGFKESLPENSEEAKELMSIVYRDMLTQQKGASRPLLDVTYSNIAASDANKVGMNIKFNQSYINKYKGSKDEAGPTRNRVNQLMTEGITIYMDKSATNNIFTEGAKRTANEVLMQTTGEINFDQAPDHVREFKVESDPESGYYKASGMINSGIRDDGTTKWQYMEKYYPYNSNVDGIVAEVDGFIEEITNQNKALEKQWMYNNLNQ